MTSVTGRSVMTVAILQGGVAALAFLGSPASAAVAAAVGALAVGRYAAVSLFASAVCGNVGGVGRLVALSAWMLGLAALAVALVAVAVKARDQLPWAVAAAVAGPVGASLVALGSGLGTLALGGRK